MLITTKDAKSTQEYSSQVHRSKATPFSINMKHQISLSIALLLALTVDARVNEHTESRVRGGARKLDHLVRGSPRNSDEKKSEKKATGNEPADQGDNNDEDSGDGLLGLLPRWFELLRPCKLLENQFKGNINCEVTLLIPLLIERQVKVEVYTDELCDSLTNRICTTPGFEVVVDFDDKVVSSTVSFEDISIGPIKIGTLDFSFDVCLDQSTPVPQVATVTESNVTAAESNITAAAFIEDPALCGCGASLAGYECNSCEFCENGGISFDCSNIVVGLTNNGACDTLARPQSVLGNGEEIDVVFPDFLLNIEL